MVLLARIQSAVPLAASPPQHYPRASWKHKGVIRIALHRPFRPWSLEVFVRRTKNRKCPNPKESDCFWYNMLDTEHFPLVVLDRIGKWVGSVLPWCSLGPFIRHLDDFQQHPGLLQSQSCCQYCSYHGPVSPHTKIPPETIDRWDEGVGGRLQHNSLKQSLAAAAAAAKLPQSCPTLCDPIDGSP